MEERKPVAVIITKQLARNFVSNVQIFATDENSLIISLVGTAKENTLSATQLKWYFLLTVTITTMELTYNNHDKTCTVST